MNDLKERKFTDINDIVVFCFMSMTVVGIIFIIFTGRGFEVLLADTLSKLIILINITMIIMFFIVKKVRKKSDVLTAMCFTVFSILIINSLNMVNHPERSSVFNSPLALIIYFIIALILFWAAIIFRIIIEEE